MKSGLFRLKIGFCILLSISATPLWGQKTLYGILYQNLEGGSGVSDVRVSARGANTTTSLSNGTFELTFADKKSGDKALIMVDRPGMEVVNLESLKPVIPASDEETLAIVMCKQGERQNFAALYYQIKINNIVEDKYKKELKEIVSHAAEGLDTDAIARITQERDQAKKQAEEMAKALAMIDLENASELYQEAFRYFTRGDIDQVMELLSEEILDAELQKADEMEQKAQAARLQVIQSYMLKARAYLLQFQFEDAANNFEKALNADSSIYENQMEFGIALMNYGYHQKADQRFQRALMLARTDPEKGHTYRCLGLNHFLQENLQQAEETSNKALNLLKGIKSAESERSVGRLYERLGLIQKIEKDFVGAEAYYDLAYAITNSIASTNNRFDKAQLASIYTNRGNLYKDQERYEEALVAAKKAVELNRELVALDSSTYLGELGLSLNNLGIVLFKLGQHTDALPQYEEALAIFKQLSPQKPIVYRQKIAITIINTCLIYIESDDHEGAIEMLSSGEEAAEWLVEHQPSILHARVQNYIYQNTGYAYAWEKDFDSSLSYYRKALAIRRQLARKNTQAFQRDVAKTLMDITTLLQAKLEQMPTHENKGMLSTYVDSTGQALLTCPDIPAVAAIQKDQAALKSYAEQVELDDLIKIKQAGDAFKVATEVNEQRKMEKSWLGSWKKLNKDFPEVTKPGMVKTYEELANSYLEGGAFEDAQTSALAGIALDSTHQNLSLILALAYAYSDNMPQAEELIQQWGNNPFRGSTWKEVMLNSLLALEKKGHTSPHATQLKSLLN